MNNSIQRNCTHRITTRLSEKLFQHIRSKANPSEYIRLLVDRDMPVVVQDEKL